MLGNLALAAATLAATATALPTYQVFSREVADRYVFYSGDGSTGAGWPAESAWGSFDELWGANEPVMEKSCGWNDWGADNSATEIGDIKSTIQQVASSTGVDPRFVLAVVMQESKGCVRAPTTDNGVRNPGLMQSHNGQGSCAGVNPCPAEQITLMIQDGVAGTSSGDGLQQTLAQASGATGGSGSRSFYAAARLYNSGSADYGNLNNGLGSTPCYATDVANRLMGWTLAASNCQA
ncbi:hypothetical protein JDV02_004110 [Purpureocillium takamizusanense]|uniref:Muramidase n=1 Tax=Purpureocillium takamizusanense TaxID=2060973 RepID=A0A9Q8QF65_9HYPO|nr:uncharacterized protein JDV02_004110 [Purpureocillium takamizusanense]UNI17791.1 hypothetical protein JDV02_004110 [Purpureocillium takamizusanense]